LVRLIKTGLSLSPRIFAAGWAKYIDWFGTISIFIDGCLEVAPGYHKRGLFGAEWETIEHLDLSYESVPKRTQQLVEGTQGGVPDVKSKRGAANCRRLCG